MKTLLDDIREIPHIGTTEYKMKDFKSEADVRWCAGCGDFAILAQLQKVMAAQGVPKENHVVISGIGCSSRFPYYMDTYGMHTLHGRALPIASGLKISRPELSVWVTTGDGDGMSIGGNHFIHSARRNIDINVLLFNNEIYSLTKGQYSPTSQPGQKTKSSPLGVIDDPFNPMALALGSGAAFVARIFDNDIKLMREFMQRASEHKGFAFLEVYSNCVIFNDGAFDGVKNKDTRRENSILVEHGKPMVFGNNNDKGIIIDGFTPKAVELNGKYSIDDLIVYDEKDPFLAKIIAEMTYAKDLPLPIGIILDNPRPSFDQKSTDQIENEVKKHGEFDLKEFLAGDNHWIVDA